MILSASTTQHKIYTIGAQAWNESLHLPLLPSCGALGHRRHRQRRRATAAPRGCPGFKTGNRTWQLLVYFLRYPSRFYSHNNENQFLLSMTLKWTICLILKSLNC